MSQVLAESGHLRVDMVAHEACCQPPSQRQCRPRSRQEHPAERPPSQHRPEGRAHSARHSAEEKHPKLGLERPSSPGPLSATSYSGALSWLPQSFIRTTGLFSRSIRPDASRGNPGRRESVRPEGRVPAGLDLLSPRPMVGREFGNLLRKFFFFFVLGFSLLLLLFSVGKKLKGPSLF